MIFAVGLALVEEKCVMDHEHFAQIAAVGSLVLPVSIAAFVGVDLQVIPLHFVVLVEPAILIAELAVGPFVVFGASFASFVRLFSISQ